MRIDRTHRAWLIASLIILGVATAIYVVYAASSPAGPSGGSAIGLTFGIVGSLCMIFAGLLAARKKVPVWRLGRAQTWMRGHLWLGLLSLPLILFHGGFRFGGPLTSVSDGAADRGGRQRNIRRGFAALHAAGDDHAHSHGNNLRAN